MARIVCKIATAFVSISIWQPWPYLGHTIRNEPMSWWFYSQPYGKDGPLQRNWLGCLWSNVCWCAIHIFIDASIKIAGWKLDRAGDSDEDK